LTIANIGLFTLGDVNNDGLKDIIFSRYIRTETSYYYALEVMFQTQEGAFGDPLVLSTGQWISGALAVGDINGDGLIDVVAATNREPIEFHIFYQNKQGGFAPVTVVSTPAHSVLAMAIADADGDGRNDIVAADDGWDQMLVFKQDTTGRLLAPDSYPYYGNTRNRQSLAVADFNGDALPDVAIATMQAGLVVFYHAPPTPSVDVYPFPVNLSTGSGGNSSRAVAVVNYGARSLKIAQIGLVGADSAHFQLLSDGCSNLSLPSLMYCTFNVALNPLSTGHKKAYAAVPSNDPLRGDIKIPLHGNLTKRNLFHPWTAFHTKADAQAVSVGDLNGDGRNDVAVTTTHHGSSDPENDYHVFVFPQDASGQLVGPARYPIGMPTGLAYSMDIGDVDGDGKADLVVGNSGSIKAFTQNGTGALDPSFTYSSGNSYAVKVADFNNDGLSDVVGIGWGRAGSAYTFAELLLQTTGHSLGSPVPYYVPYSGYNHVTAGDVNGDGLVDLIVMNGQTACPDISVLLQRQDGTFAPPRYYTTNYGAPYSVAVGDINGDGLQDIAFTYRNASAIGMFLQRPDGTMGPEITFEADHDPHAIQIADIDGDGRQDVIVSHGGPLSSFLGIFHQDTDGTLLPEELYNLPYATYLQPGGLAVGDINGDGRPDIATANYGQGLVVLYQKGPGAVPTPPTLTVTVSGKGTVTGLSFKVSKGSYTKVFHAGAGEGEILTASPDDGTTFRGWSGGGCSGTNTCIITMDSSKTVTAYFGAPCNYALSVAPKSFSYTGGTASLSVSWASAKGCSNPEVYSSSSWITAAPTQVKSNRFAVNISVPANSAYTSRNGTITIGGKVVQVVQAGIPCTLGITPANGMVNSGPQQGSFSVVAPTGCEWKTAVIAGSRWLSINSGFSGSTNGSVSYSLSENGGKSQRLARIKCYLTKTPKVNSIFTVTQQKR
jgi:hypothetical protein